MLMARASDLPSSAPIHAFTIWADKSGRVLFSTRAYMKNVFIFVVILRNIRPQNATYPPWTSLILAKTFKGFRRVRRFGALVFHVPKNLRG